MPRGGPRDGSSSKNKGRTGSKKKDNAHSLSEEDKEETSKGGSPNKRTRSEGEQTMDASYEEQAVPTETEMTPPVPTVEDISTTTDSTSQSSSPTDKGKAPETNEGLEASAHAPSSASSKTQETENNINAGINTNDATVA